MRTLQRDRRVGRRGLPGPHHGSSDRRDAEQGDRRQRSPCATPRQEVTVLMNRVGGRRTLAVALLAAISLAGCQSTSRKTCWKGPRCIAQDSPGAVPADPMLGETPSILPGELVASYQRVAFPVGHDLDIFPDGSARYAFALPNVRVTRSRTGTWRLVGTSLELTLLEDDINVTLVLLLPIRGHDLRLPIQSDAHIGSGKPFKYVDLKRLVPHPPSVD